MHDEIVMTLALALLGSIAMLAGALDWGFLVESKQRDRTRAAYVLIGFALIGAGGAFAVNVIPMLPR